MHDAAVPDVRQAARRRGRVLPSVRRRRVEQFYEQNFGQKKYAAAVTAVSRIPELS